MPPSHELIRVVECQRPLFVGIDLGGTNIKVGVVDDRGRTLAADSAPTCAPDGAERAAERMGAAVKGLLAGLGLSLADVARVGLGSPGTMDIPQGMLLEPVNLKGWNYFPLRDRVSHHCDGLPVTFENDANAAAYGEFWVGSGREFRSLVLFTLGTGIGCGIIIDDLPIDGQNSHGGECGHLIVDPSPDARRCGCGKTGHLEAYASATGLIGRAKEALAAGRASNLQAVAAQRKALTPIVIGQEAEKGDALSLELVLETARYLALGIVNVMHTVDPSVVLLGGAMNFGGHETPLGRRFLDEIKGEIRRRAFKVLAEKTVIDFASLGGDAGYIGAAGMARLDFVKQRIQ